MGAGTMGHGIAQVMAEAGLQVVMRDIEERFIDRGLRAIRSNLEKQVQGGRLDANGMEAILARIRPTLDLGEVRGVDLVVEAIVEDAAAKAALFRELDGLCPPETIFASNTSSISITSLAAATRRPDRFIGMHFFNPVPAMKLVEVVRGLGTSEETLDAIVALARALGKSPVEVRDFPGFVSNRILMPFINEAIYALMEGVGSREAIDSVARLGFNHPMGPLELADLIGLDILRQLVAAGRLGRKSGRGFYEYAGA
jgi:3-hydroxybutyryl-CoA dehydrogenase